MSPAFTRSFWLRPISQGVRKGMTLGETKRIYITNGASLFLIGFCPIFLALNLLQGNAALALVNASTTLLGGFCLFLNCRGWHRAATAFMTGGGCVLYFFSGLLFRNGIEYTLLLGMLVAVCMFETRWVRLALVLANGFGFLLVKILHAHAVVTPMPMPVNRPLINLFVFLVCFYLLLEVFRTVNADYQREMEKKNADLLQSQKELDREHEELMVRTGELKVANAAKERLFSIVAHDLRGPVGNLKATVDLLEEGAFTTADFRKVLTNLKVEVDHAYDCLDTLLAWSASQQQGIQPAFTAVRLASAARSCIALHADSAARKGITIRNTIGGGACVWADEDQLASILRNLLSNALKFTPPGGRVEIGAQGRGGAWRVYVCDTGVGMPEEKIRQLFEANGVNSTPGTGQEKGLGLGLQICREFIKSHGGELAVESRENGGSTFHFTLPAPPPATGAV